MKYFSFLSFQKRRDSQPAFYVLLLCIAAFSTSKCAALSRCSTELGITDVPNDNIVATNTLFERIEEPRASDKQKVIPISFTHADQVFEYEASLKTTQSLHFTT